MITLVTAWSRPSHGLITARHGVGLGLTQLVQLGRSADSDSDRDCRAIHPGKIPAASHRGPAPGVTVTPGHRHSDH
jgi:hypothetical protein